MSIFFRPYKSEFFPRMGAPMNCPNGNVARVIPSKMRLPVSLQSAPIIEWLLECKNKGGKIG